MDAGWMKIGLWLTGCLLNGSQSNGWAGVSSEVDDGDERRSQTPVKV